MTRMAWAGTLVIMLLVSSDPASAQCAMCRRALQSPEGQQLMGALRSGILVLLAAPFATFATVAVLAVRSRKRRSDPPLPS
jgi:hypothetical protein